MYSFLIVLYVLVSAALIGLVLLQHGKGADAGAAFGSGASGTVFGARGSATFLSRTTAWLAAVFFALSLALAYVVHGREAPTSVMDQAPPAKTEAPAPKTEPKTEPATPQAATPAAPAVSPPPSAPAANKDTDQQATTPKVPN